MDPLSVTASVIAVLQLSAKVLVYLNDVKDASKDRKQCVDETLNLRGLLFNLKDQVEWGDGAGGLDGRYGFRRCAHDCVSESGDAFAGWEHYLYGDAGWGGHVEEAAVVDERWRCG